MFKNTTLPSPLVEKINFIHCMETLFAYLPQNGAIFLDSALRCPQGRYSFIAFEPFEMLTCKNHQVFLGKNEINQSPFDLLSTLLSQYRFVAHEGLPPFQGGAAGMLGYELAGALEKLPRAKVDDLHFPDLQLGFYDLVIATDHELKQSWIFSSGFPEIKPVSREKRAQMRLNYAKKYISQYSPLSPITSITISAQEIKSTFDKAIYEKAVQKVIEYIRAGDIFEANISQRFSAMLPPALTGFELYRRLRRNNPAPFSAFMQYENRIIASASPERFLKLKNAEVEARPIKGTRHKSHDPLEDEILKKELLHSEKDRAENVMIVDLMRNDLSKVCMPFTIKVESLCNIESFATLHHLVSVVKGQLFPHYGAIDLLKATFPGGSITGAPKIRAMEIIAIIEPTVRGPYCGSIGYIGFDDSMDLSITIRTLVIKDNFCTFQVGGAVTVDSDPEQEYLETLVKAKALQRALICNF